MNKKQIGIKARNIANEFREKIKYKLKNPNKCKKDFNDIILRLKTLTIRMEQTNIKSKKLLESSRKTLNRLKEALDSSKELLKKCTRKAKRNAKTKAPKKC